MVTLPLEIVFSSILTRLPIKTLFRFKCVSKSFLAEISSPNFIKLQHLTALSSDSNRFLVLVGWDENSRNKGMYMYDLDSPHAPPSFCPLPYLSNVVASCESHLLVEYGGASSYRRSVVLINPSLRTYRQLPNLPIPHGYLPNLPIPRGNCNIQYGLCYYSDELGDDFKVVRFVDFSDNNNIQMQVAVYSLRTGLWKLIECTTPDDCISEYLSRGVFCNNLFHLIFIEHDERLNYLTSRIGCYDIKAERWGPDVPLPDYPADFVDFEGIPDLGVLDDQLCLIVRNVDELTYDLWVMKQYGVKESWVNIMTLCGYDLPPETMNCSFPSLAYHPLTWRNGSRHELLYKQDHSFIFKLFWYNLEDEESNEAEFPGLPARGSSTAFVCKGSLLNIPGSRPITAWCQEIERRSW